MKSLSRKHSFKSRSWRKLQNTEEWMQARERLLSPFCNEKPLNLQTRNTVEEKLAFQASAHMPFHLCNAIR
jgi:hypothetical protein